MYQVSWYQQVDERLVVKNDYFIYYENAIKFMDNHPELHFMLIYFEDYYSEDAA